MYISKLLIINYRSCNLLSLDFSANEPNVFIGINDCGKSTILKAVEILLAAKPFFNFVKDDKKKNDLSNTRAKAESVAEYIEQLGLPSLEYEEKKCYIIGQFYLEEEDFSEESTSNVSPQLLWLLDNVTNNCIWIGKVFEETSQGINDIILIPDVVENSKLMKLYSVKDSDLQKKRNELKITDDEIKNDNDKGRYKKMEIARAIYTRFDLSWFWSEYDSRSKDTAFFPTCRYLDWNISFEQLTEVATDVINTKITNQLDLANRFANRQARKAQEILNKELKDFTDLFATDIPNIEGFKANLSLQVKSTLTDFLINKKNTDGDIHLDQQGEGVKRQIWFALIKWKALGSIQEGIKSKKFIWCFDEPETHLYPKAQREFFDLIKSVSVGNVQSVISTHSTVFIDRAHFNTICRVELECGYTRYYKCNSVPDIYHALQVKNSDFLFYDKFLIVEGDTEEHLVPHLFSVATNNEKTLLNYGVQIINLGGKDKRSQNKAILESVLKDFNKTTDSVIYLFDNDVIFDGLTKKELNEINHFTVGRQDIEDSFSVEFWYSILQGELPEVDFSLDELTELHSSIPNDQKLSGNQKFYPKLRNELKKKLGDDRHLVDEKLPDKGRKSAELLKKYVTEARFIDPKIIVAFEQITK